MSGGGTIKKGSDGSPYISGLNVDQKNAVWIFEKVMMRTRFTASARDELADCLAHVRQGGELGKKLPTVEREKD